METDDRKLDHLYRSYEATDRYRKFKHQVAANNDTIVRYIIRNRLGWTDADGKINTVPSSKLLFTEPSDILIIENDFPYNFEDNVTHLVVWTKLPIESDPKSDIGDVSDQTKRIINRYVEKNFVQDLGLERGDIVWFRNYPAIQSVTELSHVHILLRNLSREVYDKIINTPGLTLDHKEYHDLIGNFKQD